MTHIESAIKEAVEKGEWLSKDPKIANSTRHEASYRYISEILLDATFWQALGKARGWEVLQHKSLAPKWLVYWHLFIDHLASGGTSEDFFKSLV